MVNFYRDLYPKQAETLALLTNLCGHKKAFLWKEEQETAFQKIKEMLAQHTMLTYPQLDKPFVVYTDSSDRQIGGVVTQDKKPLGFFSKKLSNTQQKYPVTEQELLAIVETLKYFKLMLLCHKITVKIDHKKLTHPTSTHSSDSVLCQRLLLEEYGVKLEYIPRHNIIVADALLSLLTQELFLFENEDEFPLIMEVLAKQQQTDKQLESL
jgi:hypothetical protein